MTYPILHSSLHPDDFFELNCIDFFLFISYFMLGFLAIQLLVLFRLDHTIK